MSGAMSGGYERRERDTSVPPSHRSTLAPCLRTTCFRLASSVLYVHSTHSPAAGGPKGFARRAPPGLRREWSEWGGLRGEGKDTRQHSTRSYRHSPKDRMFTRVFPAVSVPRLLGALFVPPSLLGSSSHETA